MGDILQLTTNLLFTKPRYEPGHHNKNMTLVKNNNKTIHTVFRGLASLPMKDTPPPALRRFNGSAAVGWVVVYGVYTPLRPQGFRVYCVLKMTTTQTVVPYRLLAPPVILSDSLLQTQIGSVTRAADPGNLAPEKLKLRATKVTVVLREILEQPGYRHGGINE